MNHFSYSDDNDDNDNIYAGNDDIFNENSSAEKSTVMAIIVRQQNSDSHAKSQIIDSLIPTLMSPLVNETYELETSQDRKPYSISENISFNTSRANLQKESQVPVTGSSSDIRNHTNDSIYETARNYDVNSATDPDTEDDIWHEMTDSSTINNTWSDVTDFQRGVHTHVYRNNCADDLFLGTAQSITAPIFTADNRSSIGVTNHSLGGFSNDTDDSDGYSFEEYSYDYSSADPDVPLGEILPVSLVYGSTLVIGVVGNLLVIVAVARDRRLRSITNIFLTSLACADLALLCFCVPVKCVAFFSFSWAFGFFLCKSVHYFQMVAMVCSVMTLTMMSIERNIAILHPLRSKRICTRGRARVLVVLVWAGSFLLAFPILIGQKHKLVGELRKAYWCVKDWEKPVYGILYETYMLVLLFLVPVGVMVVSYTTICMELSKGTKFRRQATNTQSATAYRGFTSHRTRSSSGKTRSSQKGSYTEAGRGHNRYKERMEKEKVKVIRMLIVVVVLFATCWGPILINNLLVSLGVLDVLHIGHLKPLRQGLFILSYLNSSLNPLVYGFMSRHFRRGFREAICVCCSKGTRRTSSGRLTKGGRTNNMSCRYTSEGQTSIVRTGTIRLSPAVEQRSVVSDDETDIQDSFLEDKGYGRKVWARSDRAAVGLHA